MAITAHHSHAFCGAPDDNLASHVLEAHFRDPSQFSPCTLRMCLKYMLLATCDLVGFRFYVIMHQAGFACLESPKVIEFERQVPGIY